MVASPGSGCWRAAPGAPRVPASVLKGHLQTQQSRSPAFTCNTEILSTSKDVILASRAPFNSLKYLLPRLSADESRLLTERPKSDLNITHVLISLYCQNVRPISNSPRRRGSVDWIRAFHLQVVFFTCNASKGLNLRPCDSRQLASAIGCLATTIATLALIRDDPAG